MNFHDAHEAFLHDHETRRNGARLSRLKEGHEHAEILFLQMVWWPAFGHFHHLHPEYVQHERDQYGSFLIK